MRNATDKLRDRVYQMSSNRGRSSHKLRYIEASAPAADACRLCVGSIADMPVATANVRSTAVQENDEFPQHGDP